MQDEPEIPTWCARMPGDPEIDRDVKTGEEKLWEACYDNKTEKVEQILKMLNDPDGPGLDLNWSCTPNPGVFMAPAPRHNGWTPYHVACAYGDLSAGKVVELMIDAGVDMDALNKLGYSGWDLAKMNGQHRILKILEQRASGGTIASNGETAGRNFDPTARTGQLYDQKRSWCVTREFRAPLADMAYWGAAGGGLKGGESSLQEVETAMAAVEKKIDKMHQLEAKLVNGEQLTPFEQQQVKPKRAEVLATWPGHDYHGAFLGNRIEELEGELGALEAQQTELVLICTISRQHSPGFAVRFLGGFSG